MIILIKKLLVLYHLGLEGILGFNLGNLNPEAEAIDVMKHYCPPFTLIDYKNSMR